MLSTTAGPYERAASASSPRACRSTCAVLSHAERRSDLGHRAGAAWIAWTSRCRRGPGSDDHAAVVHYSTRMPDHHVVDLIDGARVTLGSPHRFDLGGVLPESVAPVGDRGRRNKRVVHRRRDRRGLRGPLRAGRRRGRPAWHADWSRSSSAPAARPCRSSSSIAGGAGRRGPSGGVQQHPVVLSERSEGAPDLAMPSRRVGTSRSTTNEWHATPTASPRTSSATSASRSLGWETPAVHGSGSLRRNLRRVRSPWSAPSSISASTETPPPIRAGVAVIRQLFAAACPRRRHGERPGTAARTCAASLAFVLEIRRIRHHGA